MQMKYIVPIIILTAVFTITGQESRKAQQVDEFGDVTCEDLLARADNFLTLLNKNPSMTGLVVLDSPPSGRDKTPYYRRLILKNFQRLAGPADRLRFYRRDAVQLGATLWLLPQGADIPFLEAQLYTEAPLDLTRPFVWDTIADESPCPTFAPNVYAELLKSNKNLRGHIVVHDSTRKEALRTGAEWIKELTERWGVPRSQLRLFIGKYNKNWYSTEFWLVPIKKK